MVLSLLYLDDQVILSKDQKDNQDVIKLLIGNNHIHLSKGATVELSFHLRYEESMRWVINLVDLAKKCRLLKSACSVSPSKR